MDGKLLENVTDLVRAEAEQRGETLSAEQLRNLAEARIRAFVEEADRANVRRQEGAKAEKTKSAFRRMADMVIMAGCIAAIYKAPDLLTRGALKDITITKDKD